MKQEGYFDRKMTTFPNGHAEVGSQEVHYEAYAGGKSREDAGFPGMVGNQWYLVDLFPGYSYNLRASVLRVDSQIPLGPNKTIVEYRSLGLKSDTEKQRRQRVKDNVVIWGPFGRNLHEDLLAVYGQGAPYRTVRVTSSTGGRKTPRSTTRSACATSTRNGASLWVASPATLRRPWRPQSPPRPEDLGDGQPRGALVSVSLREVAAQAPRSTRP